MVVLQVGAQWGCGRGSLSFPSTLRAHPEEVRAISLKKGVVVEEQLQNAKERS